LLLKILASEIDAKIIPKRDRGLIDFFAEVEIIVPTTGPTERSSGE
jgi:hypothetical protein